MCVCVCVCVCVVRVCAFERVCLCVIQGVHVRVHMHFCVPLRVYGRSWLILQKTQPLGVCCHSYG